MDDAQKGAERGIQILKADEPSTVELETAVACFEQAEMSTKLQQTMGALPPLARARALDKMGNYDTAYRTGKQAL